MDLFRTRERSVRFSEGTRENGMRIEGENELAETLRALLGFDPALHYMTQMSEEYKNRASPLIQIITLMDSVCNGVSNIIDEAYASNSTPHAHISAPDQKESAAEEGGPWAARGCEATEGTIMPKKIERKWSQLETLDGLINELRKWTKQTTKNATAIQK